MGSWEGEGQSSLVHPGSPAGSLLPDPSTKKGESTEQAAEHMLGPVLNSEAQPRDTGFQQDAEHPGSQGHVSFPLPFWANLNVFHRLSSSVTSCRDASLSHLARPRAACLSSWSLVTRRCCPLQARGGQGHGCLPHPMPCTEPAPEQHPREQLPGEHPSLEVSPPAATSISASLRFQGYLCFKPQNPS